jgi:hypothetical protein
MFKNVNKSFVFFTMVVPAVYGLLGKEEQGYRVARAYIIGYASVWAFFAVLLSVFYYWMFGQLPFVHYFF